MGLFADWIDVTAYADGGTELADAFAEAIAQVPDNEEIDDLPDRRDHGTAIYVPAAPQGKHWTLRRTVTVPASKNVRITGPTIGATRLVYTVKSGPAFLSLGRSGANGRGAVRRRSHAFENLWLDGGGIHIEEHAAFFTEIVNCTFTRIPGFAVEALGTMVVGVRVLNCDFFRTGGGVLIGRRGCDNWLIGDNTRFVRLSGVGVHSRSTGVTVRDARFETKARGAIGQPHILIEGDPQPVASSRAPLTGGACEIASCRFGDELAKDSDGPPEVAIELRPLTSRGTPGGSISGMVIHHNRFFGANRNPNTGDTSGTNAIAVRAGGFRHSVITSNVFFGHRGPIVLEEAPDGSKVPTNYFTSNAVYAPAPLAMADGTVLSSNGVGWVTDHPS